MRHRIKKIPTLGKLHHLLHSDKSTKTYFYNIISKVVTLFRFVFHSTNDVRWTSPHHDKTSFPTETALVNRTRSSRKTTSFSGIGSQTRLNTIPLVLSASALLVVLGIMICPLTPDSRTSAAYATSEDSSSDSNAGIDAQALTMPTSGVALELNTSPNKDNLYQEQITDSNTTSYIKVNFTVGANDISRYDVYVQADRTALTGQTTEDTIQSITTDSVGQVGSKSWGYGVSRGDVEPSTITYKAIQTNVSKSADTMLPTSGSTITNLTQPYTLAFAANLDGAKADHYKSNITLSVAANAKETTLSNIGFGDEENQATYMQDVDKAFCDKLPKVTSDDNVIEGRLIDKRDNKVYWVAKLKDNNCWMTQNLDLDLTEGKALTSDLSDVGNWTPGEGATTLVAGELNSTSWPNTSTIIRSYDPGAAIFINGMDRKETGLALAFGKEWLTPEEAKLPEGSTETRDPNFVTATSYTSADGKMVCTKKTSSMVGDMTSTYLPCRIYYYEYLNIDNLYAMKDPAHYLQGNYYSWSAATAGTGNNITSTNSKDYPAEASGSICPKGWRLPIGHKKNSSGTNITNTIDGSFAKLTTAYSISDSTPGAQTLRRAPLYFVYNGYVNSGSLRDVGNGSNYYFSATTNHAAMAYSLYFWSQGVDPSITNNRHYGVPVRCVVR